MEFTNRLQYGGFGKKNEMQAGYLTLQIILSVLFCKLNPFPQNLSTSSHDAPQLLLCEQRCTVQSAPRGHDQLIMVRQLTSYFKGIFSVAYLNLSR